MVYEKNNLFLEHLDSVFTTIYIFAVIFEIVIQNEVNLH